MSGAPQYSDIDPWEALASVQLAQQETPLEMAHRWITKGPSGWERYLMHRMTDTLTETLRAATGAEEGPPCP